MATLVAIAFHASLWSVFASGPLSSVASLVVLTLGAGLTTSLVTAAVLLARDGAESA